MNAYLWLAALPAGFVLLSICFMAYGCAAAMLERDGIPALWWPGLLVAFVVGLVLDLAFNAVAGWILFAESPLPLVRDWALRLLYIPGRFVGMDNPGGELTFSERVKRHWHESSGWRQREATAWARALNAAVPNHIT